MLCALALGLMLSGMLSRGALAQQHPAGAERAVSDDDGGADLERARDALEAGDAATAIAIAREHTERRPDDADGWTVLGLAHFALGEHERALASFERALSRLDAEGAPEAAWLRLNRAACIFELGRMEQAESAYVEAGRDQPAPLSVLAAVNAGYAALELGALERARAHLSRADALDVDAQMQDARDDLRAELQPSDPGDDGGDDGARSEVDEPDLAREAYDEGVVAYARGSRSLARERFRQARARGLDAGRDDNAVAYLDALAGGLRSIGRGWGASISLGFGYDDNVAQSGIGDATAPLSFDHAEQGSALVSAGGEVGYGLSLSRREFMLLEYSLEQLAYTDGDLDVFNSQDHALELGVEHSATQALRLGVAGRALYSIAGLRDFAPLSWTGGGEGWATFEYAEHHETTLRGTLLYTTAIDDAFAFLEGSRVEAGVDQLYRRGRLRAGGGVRYRSEALGKQTVVVTDPSTGSQNIYEIPLSYRGPGLYAWSSLRLLSRIRASARLSAEWRFHSTPSKLDVVVDTVTNRRRGVHERLQRDQRFGAGGGVTFDLGGPFELYVGYQLNVGASNIDNTAGEGHELDYGNLNYTRNLVELELGAHF